MLKLMFAIISEKGADSQKTVEFLQKLGVDDYAIYVYMKNEKDFREYVKVKPKRLNLQCKEFKTLSEGKNKILNHAKLRGYHIVFIMPDDIIGFKGYIDGEEPVLVNTLEAFDEMIKHCFATTRDRNGLIFGMNEKGMFIEGMRAVSTLGVISDLPIGVFLEPEIVFDESFNRADILKLSLDQIKTRERSVVFNTVWPIRDIPQKMSDEEKEEQSVEMKRIKELYPCVNLKYVNGTLIHETVRMDKLFGYDKDIERLKRYHKGGSDSNTLLGDVIKLEAEITSKSRDK